MSAPRIYKDLVQGTDEWLAARCGMLTASEIGLIITPGWKPAGNGTSRAHLHELVAQRITQHVEPRFISDDMLRGMNDEADARALYAEHHAPVEHVGFITQDFMHGGMRFRLGYSPDGLVREDGLIEIKSRRQKFQVQTFLDGGMPTDFAAQVQAGLLISGREWCDFISYSAGLPLFIRRVHADPQAQAAILDACALAEEQMAQMLSMWRDVTRNAIPTERKIEEEMYL